MDGNWKQYEIYDRTYSIDDLMDYIEIKIVNYENQKRSYEANKLAQKAKY